MLYFPFIVLTHNIKHFELSLSMTCINLSCAILPAETSTFRAFYKFGFMVSGIIFVGFISLGHLNRLCTEDF